MNYIDTFKALADESRLRIVNVLRHGYFNVQELTGILGLTQSTISHHLKILNAAGITETHKEGTWTFHRLLTNPEMGPRVLTEQFLTLQDNEPDEALVEIFSKDNSGREKILTNRRKAGQAFFEKVAKEWKNIRSEQVDDSSFLDSIVSRIPANSRVLDLGCGSGVLLEKIARVASSTIGVDFSQAMLDEARKTLNGQGEKCELRLGYLEHLPLGDDSIDSAIAYMVMHHIPEPKEAIRDAFRVIANNGQLMILDLVSHNDEHMRERYGDLWLGFNPDEMALWAKETGFTEVSYDFFGASEEVFLLTCIK